MFTPRQRLFQAVLDPAALSSPKLLTKKASDQVHLLSSLGGLVLKHEQQSADTFIVKETIPARRKHLNPSEKESKQIKMEQEAIPCGSQEDQETLHTEAAGTRNPETPSTSAIKVIPKGKFLVLFYRYFFCMHQGSTLIFHLYSDGSFGVGLLRSLSFWFNHEFTETLTPVKCKVHIHLLSWFHKLLCFSDSETIPVHSLWHLK